jgi:hypothetical protein
LHAQARARHARLAGVEEDADGDAADHGIHVGIRRHHHRRLAAQFQPRYRTPRESAQVPGIGRTRRRAGRMTLRVANRTDFLWGDFDVCLS